MSNPFTIKAETSVLKAWGGKGMVTSTVTDNDKTPVAGQPVFFTVGKKTTKVVTSKNGIAVLKGVAKGTAVKVSFTAVAGKYTAATPVSTKAL